MKRILAILLALFCCAASYAQQETFLPFASSSAGNYLYLVPQAMLNSGELEHTTGFVIERLKWDTLGNSRDTSFKRIDRVEPVQSLKELKRLFTREEMTEMIKSFSLATPEELLNYFKTRKNPSDYSLYYQLLNVRLALGHVYLDENVKKGQVFLYRVSRMIDGNTDDPVTVGKIIMISKAGNYTLPYYRPVNTEANVIDSTGFFTWKMHVGVDVLKSIPAPHSPLLGDEAGVAGGYPDDGSRLIATIKKTSDTGLVTLARLLPVLNPTRDTVTYSYRASVNPGSEISLSLALHDEVGNEGMICETVTAYGVNQATAPLIYGLHVTDTIDGIFLKWNPLPGKPYITGIEIKRTNSKNITETIATLPPGDTTYIDYNIEIGHQYSYHVRTLFKESILQVQKIPAEGTGAYTRFSKPEQPQNLRAANVGRNIQLLWDSSASKGIYGYYIYRGTRTNDLSLIAGPVKTASFLDTSASLSGKSQYYYSVMAQNYRQDTSLLSDVVQITPKRAVETALPSNISFNYINGSVIVSWDDIKLRDDGISNYILQRSAKGNDAFNTLAVTTIANFSDSLIVRGNTYTYRVAAVSVAGDTSKYSDPKTFVFEKHPVGIMGEFYVRNTYEGVVVSWAGIEYEKLKTFNIYRRQADEPDFKRISIVNKDRSSFTDRSAAVDVTYVYSISITESDDREGDKNSGISIKRKAVKEPVKL